MFYNHENKNIRIFLLNLHNIKFANEIIHTQKVM